MPNIISKFKSLWKTDGREIVPVKGKALFSLVYKDLEIGTLMFEDGTWAFQYSAVFKNQTELKPLVDFPNLEKVYSFRELPPFFAHRIPGLGQPKVQKILSKENISEDNEVDLLKRFGKLSIANPFRLIVNR